MASVGVDSYTLKMIDQMTAPLRAIEKQMERTSAGMSSLQKLATAAFAGGAVIAGIKLIGGAIGGLVSIMGAGIGVAKRFMGAVLEAAKFRQQSITSLDILLGKGRGEGAFRSALRIGGMSAMSESDVVKQVKELAAGGFSGSQLSRANAALLDVQGIMGDEKRKELQDKLTKFYSGTKFEADDLREAARNIGFKERDLVAKLVGNTGAVPKQDIKALSDQFDGLKKAGKITGEQVVEALFEGIKQRFNDGGPLGTAAKKIGMGSIAGLLSNLEEAPKRFMMEMKLEELPGIKTFMEFLKRLLVFFDHATPQGKQLAKVVADISNALFGGFSKISTDTLGRFFRSGLTVAKQLVVVIQKAWGLVDSLINGKWNDVLGAAAPFFFQMGKLIGQGIWEGLWAAAPQSKGLLDSRQGPGAPAPLTGQSAGASARAGFGEALGKVAGTGGKLVQGFGEALTSAGGVAGKVGGDLGGAFGKVFRDLGKGLGFGKTEVKIENLNVGAGVTQEEGRVAGNAMAEGIRNSNLRTGAQPAAAQ